MQRGYARQIRSNSLDKQMAALEAAGVSPIYTDESPIEAITSLRVDEDDVPDELCIAGSLRILADTRDQLLTAMTMVHDQGCTVRDVISDRVAGDAGAVLAVEAMGEIAREKVKHLDHKGAAFKRWGKTVKATLKRQALKAWRDVVKYPTVDDALASDDMAGWSRSMAYHKRKGLGRRNPPYGTVNLEDDD